MDFMDIYAFFTIEASLFLNIYHSDSVRTSFYSMYFILQYVHVCILTVCLPKKLLDNIM